MSLNYCVVSDCAVLSYFGMCRNALHEFYRVLTCNQMIDLVAGVVYICTEV